MIIQVKTKFYFTLSYSIQVKHNFIRLPINNASFVAAIEGPIAVEVNSEKLPQSKRVSLTVQTHQENRKRKLRFSLLSLKTRQSTQFRSQSLLQRSRL